MKKRCYKLLTLCCVLCLAFSALAFTGCGEKEQETGAGSTVSAQTESLSAETETAVTEDNLSAEPEVQPEADAEAETETKEQTETKEDKDDAKSDSGSSSKEESKAEEKPSTSSTENKEEVKEEVKEEAPAVQTGKYSGSHKKYVDAMGQDVSYKYSITLNEDGSYKYSVSFSVTMGGETKDVTESESGTYSISGSSISFSGDNGSFSGSISGNTISVNRVVSSFASDSITIKLKK